MPARTVGAAPRVDSPPGSEQLNRRNVIMMLSRLAFDFRSEQLRRSLTTAELNQAFYARSNHRTSSMGPTILV